jgi:AbrB family looped-hinge helix DNA binding protein
MADDAVEVRVGSQGRIVLPSHIREQLGAEEGTVYMAHVEDEGRLVLETRDAIVRRWQSRLQAVSGDRSLADELIEERRREATDGSSIRAD